jgi:Fic family protein
MHARLLQSGRGGTKDPGEFRRSQNWIGGTRPGNALYVPPPVTELDGCLGALESFLHEEQSRLPALIKAGLLHVQFESIHPFLDGNGRIGRLLVTLYLCVTSNQLVDWTGLTAPTVNAELADLERLGIVEEVTGRKRGRVFAYRSYLAILNEGTTPLQAMPRG